MFTAKNDTQIRQINTYLECVCLLLTGDEIENGLFDRFVEQLNSVPISSDPTILKEINFIILHKDDKILEKDLSVFENKFSKFSLLKINIPNEYDFYLRQNSLKEVPNLELYDWKDYGLKSGANFAFFNSFEHLKNFDTTLFLECDCFLGEDWLERIYDFTSSSGGFWSAGSVYDNEKANLLTQVANTHLNGGIALYATSNVFFRKFLIRSANHFSKYLKVKPNLPYDYYLRMYVEDSFNTDRHNRYYWNFVKRQFLICNLIFNYSPARDSELNVLDLKKRHNFAILHKK